MTRARIDGYEPQPDQSRLLTMPELWDAYRKHKEKYEVMAAEEVISAQADQPSFEERWLENEAAAKKGDKPKPNKPRLLTGDEIYNICHPEGTGLSTDPDDIGDYSWKKPQTDRKILEAQRDLTASEKDAEIVDLVGRYSRLTNELVAKLDKEHSARIDVLIETLEPYIKQVVDCDKFKDGDALLDPVVLTVLAYYWEEAKATTNKDGKVQEEHNEHR